MRSDAALMFRSSCHRFVSLAVVLLSGCFAELDTGDEPDTTSSSQTCTPGSVACACYGNGTCDAGLQCVAEISACVPSGCMPGTLQCVCDGALCAQDLECNAGLCVEPEGGSSSSGELDTADSTSTSDASATSDGPTSAPTTTDDPSTTMTDPSSSSTASDSDSDSDSESTSSSDSDSDTGDPACDEMPCGACVECVVMPQGECADEAAQCDANVGCGSTATCLASCAVKGICFDDCCEDKTPAAIDAALALNACREDACAGVAACGNYNNGICGG